MKKISLLILILTAFLPADMLFSQETKSVLPDSVNLRIISCVESSKSSFLDNIPEGMLSNYGLNNKDEITKSSIGNPLKVYTILNDQLSFSNTWRVPLVVDKNYRALFSVIIDEKGEYKIVDFGATLLASIIFNESRLNDLQGLLRVYEIKKDFFIYEKQNGEYEYEPIPEVNKAKYSLDEILKLKNN